MIIGNRKFKNNHTHIMGILNITPDSFSDGGMNCNLSDALKRVEKMIKEGADIIDIGGESTRPGYTEIAPQEEIARITPIIEAIKSNFDIPISVDTYKASVACEAIKTGADMVNDIWGLKHDTDMAKVIAENKKAICLMHNRTCPEYKNLIEDVISDLKESIFIAKTNGINKIIIDPGIGFAKTYEDNLAIVNNLDKLHSLGYPILLGASRKSIIGLTLDLPVTERVEGTLATTVLACLKGAMFVRVHDIKENYRAIKMTEAIINA